MAEPTVTLGALSTGLGTSVQPALPAYISGDLLLAWCATDGDETHTIDQSYVGIATLVNVQSGVMTHSLFAKIASASETAPIISFTSEEYRSLIVRLRGQDGTWEGAKSVNTGDSAIITATGITTTASDSMVLAFGANDRDRGTPALQEAWADESSGSSGGSGGTGSALASKGFASSSSATGNVTWTISSSDGFSGFQLEILALVIPPPGYFPRLTNPMVNPILRM